MGSGLIYAAVIVMWAAYFIPRWLRKHEELSESRSVEKFDHAMRILSRRETVGDQRYIVMPPRQGAADDIRRTAGAGLARRSRSGPPGVSRVAMRRRRLLAGLLVSTLVATGVAPLTPAPWWAPLVALGATLAFLVHCRLQARTRREVSRTRSAVRRRSRSRLMRFDAIERLMAVRREQAEDRAAEEQRWLEAGEAEGRERAAEERRRAEAAAGWAPVPVPLPTYVSKPKAPSRTQPIDLTRPGAWTETQARAGRGEEQPFDQSVPRAGMTRPPAPMSALLDDAADAEEQLDAIIARRAVND